jgi:hypothetical protein
MNFVEYEFLIYRGIIQAWALTSSKTSFHPLCENEGKHTNLGGYDYCRKITKVSFETRTRNFGFR